MSGDVEKALDSVGDVEALGDAAAQSYEVPQLTYVGNLREILASSGSPINADGGGFRD